MIAVNTAAEIEEIDATGRRSAVHEATRRRPDVETLLAMGWELHEIEDLLDQQQNLARRPNPESLIPNP